MTRTDTAPLHSQIGLRRAFAEIALYGHLIRNLVVRDLRLRYKGTSLGFFWSLANPLLMLGVYTFAFRYILEVPVENFPLFFFIGFLLWNFLATTLHASATCIVANSNLLNKVYFPRAVLPLSVLLSSGVQFVLSAISLSPVLYWVGMPLGPPLVMFPVLLFLAALFIFGLAQLVAVSHTYYRDTLHLLDFGLALWFWLTPIVYTLDLVPERIRPLFFLNPMAVYVQAFRDIAFYGVRPSAVTAVGLVVCSLSSFLLGSWVFQRYSGKLAELV